MGEDPRDLLLVGIRFSCFSPQKRFEGSDIPTFEVAVRHGESNAHNHKMLVGDQ
jgi:hypothetical protein